MDWKHTYIITRYWSQVRPIICSMTSSPGHSIFMVKLSLQNRLTVHPYQLTPDYAGKDENKVPAQEMMQILESRYKEAERELTKTDRKIGIYFQMLSEVCSSIPSLCTYASDILQGAYRVKTTYFPSGICKPNGKNMEGDSAALYSVS